MQRKLTHRIYAIVLSALLALPQTGMVSVFAEEEPPASGKITEFLPLAHNAVSVELGTEDLKGILPDTLEVKMEITVEETAEPENSSELVSTMEGTPEGDNLSALEESTGEETIATSKEVTIVLPVSQWVSEPEYNAQTAGDYVFTPELSDVYQMEEGLELPKIMVTVAQKAEPPRQEEKTEESKTEQPSTEQPAQKEPEEPSIEQLQPKEPEAIKSETDLSKLSLEEQAKLREQLRNTPVVMGVEKGIQSSMVTFAYTEEPFIIGSLDTLKELADKVNNGATWGSGIPFADCDYRLDVNLSGIGNWIPIGTESNPFHGTFDGGGHEIQGVTINAPTEDNQGFFGYTGEKAEIKNLGVTEVKIVGRNYVGGVAGYNYGTISNSYSTGSVKAEKNYAGGIAGYNFAGSIISSYSAGSVTAVANYAGGIAGENSTGTISSSYSTGNVTADENYAGGIAGVNDTGTISSSYSTGNVTAEKEFAGGIIAFGSDGGNITNCYSIGSVTAVANYAGGIAGKNDGEITGSYSTGSVTAKGNYAGGIAGVNDRGGNGTITNCYSTGNVTANGSYAGGIVGVNYGTISSSYSIGSVTADDNYAGGIAGVNYSAGIITNCTALNVSVSGSSQVGKSVGSNNGTLSNNYAIDTMKVTGTGGVDGDPLTYSNATGFSKSWADIFSDTSLWENTGQNQLPTLIGVGGSQSSDVPEYMEKQANFVIKDLAGLKQFRDNVTILGDTYEGKIILLSADIQIPPTESNWTPIGTIDKPFNGTFDGGGHEIQGLTIDASTADNQGFFGYTGTEAEIKNLGVTDVDLTGNTEVGGIAGRNDGTITNSYSTGSVTANAYAGGIAGWNDGSIISSYSTGSITVNKNSNAGGIAGSNDGRISNSYSTGSIKAENNYAGGIAGSNAGRISNSYSTGSVTANKQYAGGIAGSNYGSISNSYSTGSIKAEKNHAGGIAGENATVGSISSCAALNPSVSGGSQVGRIVGSNNGTLSNNYALATMEVTGSGGNDGDPLTYSNATGFSKNWAEIFSDTSHWENTGIHQLPTLTGVGGSQSSDVPGYMEKQPSHVIKDLAGLKQFRDNVTIVGDTYDGKTILLLADIQIPPSESDWIPIGTKDKPFNGTFDGGGHEIQNIKINAPGTNYQGLFGYIEEKAEIKNLGVTDIDILGNENVGGITGYNKGTITNSYIAGSVTAINVGGGIAGTNHGEITNSYSTGDVTAKGSHAGGIAGFNVTGEISSCYSTGDVTANGSYAGGIAGYNVTGKISSCYSTGNVTTEKGDQAGGIAGYSGGKISSSYNTGSVTAKANSYAGGIAGENDGEIDNSYSTGNVTANKYAGGIIGVNNYNATITNCAALNSSVSADSGSNAGRIVGSNAGTLTGNYAIDTMEVTGSGGNDGDPLTYSNATGFNKSWADIFSDTSHWENTGQNQLPTLKGVGGSQSRDVPEYMEKQEKLVIKNLAELKKFRDKVNSGTDYKDKTILLSADIQIPPTESDWTPIGTEKNPFNGTFDGGGHKIQGLTINASTANNQGFFGYTGAKAEINNLGVTDVNIVSNIITGGIAGENRGSITGCYSTGSVSANGNTVGGIVGYNYGTVTSCYSTSDISSTGSFAGGIAGFNENKAITNCYSTGNIIATRDYAGGIAGNNNGSISSSYSTGNITAKNNYVGGIVGNSDADGKISNCYSTGSVTANNSYAGGVAGYTHGSITSCYSISSITAKNNYAGGIAGFTEDSIISCAALNSSVSGNGNVGRIAGKDMGTLTRNYALADLPVTDEATKGENAINGADGYLLDLVQNQTLFPSPNWILDKNYYPILAAFPDSRKELYGLSGQTPHEVIITAHVDGKPAGAGIGGTFVLKSGSKEITDFKAVENGVYDLYYNGMDTGVKVMVHGKDVPVTVDFYSISFYDEDVLYEDTSDQKKQYIMKNTTAVKPPNPQKSGYTFDNWMTAKDNGTEFDFHTPITQPTALYASWTKEASGVFISGVKISPEAVTLGKGETQQFQAEVTGSQGIDKRVSWAVSGNTSEQTQIDEKGLLTIAPEETAEKLTVTATANGDITKKATAEVTVGSGILQVNPSAVDFGTLKTGYAKPEAKTVTVTNIGTANLTIAVSKAEYFELGILSQTALKPSEKATFTITPKAGLAAGSYEETVTMTAEDKPIATLSAKLTVENKTSHSGGGGSSSGSGSSGVSTKDGVTTITTSGTVLKSTADKGVEQAKNKNSHTIQVVSSGNKVTLPVGMTKAIAEKTTATLVMETKKGSVSIPNKVLKGMETEGNLIVTIDNNKVTILVNGKERTEIGNIRISIPYEKNEKTGNAAVEIKNSDGTKTVLENVYDGTGNIAFEAQGSVSFTILDHYVPLGDKPAPPSNPFIDMENHWAKEAVLKAFQMGLFSGMEEDKFALDVTISRGMILSVLYRMSGETAVGENTFQDVSPDAYYAEAAAWAKTTGIVSGYGNGLFLPEQSVTREQTAVMLYNYAKYMGMDVNNIEGMAIQEFSDYNEISGWAVPAVRFCLNAGTISGRINGSYDPKGEATRAEAASMLVRFVESAK